MFDSRNLSKQASIAKAIEEKVSGEQRRFFLMEQFKAIKKVGFHKCDLRKSTITVAYLCICFTQEIRLN